MDVTVVIPTFNRAQVIGRAIESVLAQTFPSFELIVVDDGSVDDTPERVMAFQDPRVVYHRQENRGRSAARNAGAAQARGRYLTFLDSDDEALPEWLATFAERFGEGRTGLVCCGCKERAGGGARGIEKTILPSPRPALDNTVGLFLAGTFAVRRELFLGIGGYADVLCHAENSELSFRLVPSCLGQGWQIQTVHQPLVIYNKPAPTAMTTVLEQRLASLEWILARHGAMLRRRFPRGYANYRVVAAVDALRLGAAPAARKHLLAALGACPWQLKNYLRLALALAPALGRKYWLRDDHGV